MSELEPLDDDLLALVKASKHLPEIDAGRKAAIFAATSARIGGGAGDGGGGHDGSGGAGTGAGVGAGLGGKLAVALLVGVVLGIGVDRVVLGRDVAPVASVASSAPVTLAPVASVATPASAMAAVSAASLPDAPAVHAPGARVAGSIEAPSSRGLAAERALLDVARASLARGEPAEALVATGRHAHEYPDGVLVEEREAIAVKSLVALGRMDEARSRARALEQRFPNGLTVGAAKAAAFGR
jgi:hypothetical protein